MNSRRLSTLESDVLTQIESNSEPTVGLLQSLVRFRSVNPPGQEEACAHFVAEQLRSLGLRPKLIEAQPGRPNIIAVLHGDGRGRDLCLYGGHLDVVPEGDRELWSVDPFAGVVQDGWIYGRGAADHKGCVAASLMAIRALREKGIQLQGDLAYTVVADEETGGHLGAKYLVDHSLLRGDLGLYASPGKLDQIIIGSKGSLQLRIRIKGRGTHAGTPWLGINPIEQASKLVRVLHSLPLDKENASFRNSYGLKLPGTGALSVTILQAGDKINVIPETCTLGIDRRLIPEEKAEEALIQIQGTIDRLETEDPDFRADIQSVDNASEAVFVSPDNPMVSIIRQAAATQGIAAEVSTSFGSSDTRWIVNQGNIPMVTYGAGLLGPDGNLCIHAPNECIEIDALMKMTKILALCIMRACGVA